MEKEYPKNARRALRRMDIGDTITWPITRTNTIRTTINSLKLIDRWNWTTQKIWNDLIVTRIIDREPIRE